MKHFIKYKSGPTTWMYFQVISVQKCSTVSSECKDRCKNRRLILKSINIGYQVQRCGIIDYWKIATKLEVFEALIT